jgi:hypothetical protein
LTVFPSVVSISFCFGWNFSSTAVWERATVLHYWTVGHLVLWSVGCNFSIVQLFLISQ